VSTLSELLTATKNILLVTEDIKRLTQETESLASKVASHEHRLIRIETMIEMSGSRRPRRVLPGE
jgi:hypothetical protein